MRGHACENARRMLAKKRKTIRIKVDIILEKNCRTCRGFTLHKACAAAHVKMRDACAQRKGKQTESKLILFWEKNTGGSEECFWWGISEAHLHQAHKSFFIAVIPSQTYGNF